jgi:hypothetical protein
MAARMTIAQPAEKWTGTLEVSRDRLLAAAPGGKHAVAILAHATAGRIVAAWTLDPAASDPATHVERTHMRCRRHLRRLLDQPANAEVVSPMTNQLFDRLTQPADPSKRKNIDYTSITSYTYTPRKPLRRVLDHALDHLNPIDQWQRWRHDDVVPVPTDGWVPSTVTLPEDRPTTDGDGVPWRDDLRNEPRRRPGGDLHGCVAVDRLSRARARDTAGRIAGAACRCSGPAHRRPCRYARSAGRHAERKRDERENR